MTSPTRLSARWLGLAVLLTGGCSLSAPGAEQRPREPMPLVWLFGGTSIVMSVVCLLQLRRGSIKPADASSEAQETAIALEQANVRIQRFTESQELFVGNLAREIKAPIATILIQADLLAANGNDRTTVHRYSKSIAEDLRHLSDLVESFLRLARPFAQEDTSTHVPVHFHDMVLEAVRRCRSLAAARAVSFVPILAETPGMNSVEVLGDAVLLEVMIENLVRNSVLSAPRGTRVDLHVTTKGDTVVLAIRDRGVGVDVASLDRVFEGFFRVPATTRPFTGSGLSLAIAKRVAEHHNGTLSLHNVDAGGCEFAVRLPRWKADGSGGHTNGHAGEIPPLPTHAGPE